MSHLAATHLVCGICAHQGTVKECDGCYLRVCGRCDCQAHDRCRFCEDCCVRLNDSSSTSSLEEGAILTRRQDARALGSLPALGGSRCVGQLRQRCLAGSRVFFPWETRPILRCHLLSGVHGRIARLSHAMFSGKCSGEGRLAAQGILRAWAEEYSELAPVADARHLRVLAARVQNICHHRVNNFS